MAKPWRLVPALEQFRSQLNQFHPLRSRLSDGTKGDDAHARRQSYHNPDVNGWVHAFDCTHDPAHGVDIGRLTDELVRSPVDPRILELIANGWYWHFRNPRWVKYLGSNGHFKHMHITVKPGLHTAINPAPWKRIPTLGNLR